MDGCPHHVIFFMVSFSPRKRLMVALLLFLVAASATLPLLGPENATLVDLSLQVSNLLGTPIFLGLHSNRNVAAPRTAVIVGAPLVSPDVFIDFDDQTFSTFAPLTNQYAALGVVFNPNTPAWFVDTFYSGAFPNAVGQSAMNFDQTSGVINFPVMLTFPSPVSGVTFAVVTNPGTTVFSSYLGATLVETFTAPTGYTGDFFGFTNSNFDSIVIDSCALTFRVCFLFFLLCLESCFF